MGFTEIIEPEDLAAHIRRTRAEGFPEYTVRPEGRRDLYTPLLYIDPLNARSRRAMGYDMFSSPVRRAAMERARDTGEITLSGRVMLNQEKGQNPQAGFLLYLPIYARGVSSATVKERRAAIRGFVLGVFRMGHFMGGVFPKGSPYLDFSLYDGDRVSQETLMYGTGDPDRSPEEKGWPLFSSRKTLDLYGHRWTLTFEWRPALEASLDRYTGKGILAAGMLISFLAFLSLWMQERTSRRAFSLARHMTEALRESEEKYRVLNNNLSVGVALIGPDMTVLAANVTKQNWFPGVDLKRCPPCYAVFDIPPRSEPCEGCPVVLTFADGKMHEAQREANTSNGRCILEIRTAPILDAAGNIVSVHETVEDVTRQREAEAALRESEARYRLLAENSGDAIWTIDLSGRLTYISPAIEKLTGYTPEEMMAIPMTGYMVEEDCERVMAHLAGELAKPPAERAPSRTMEVRYRAKDGRTVDVEFNAWWALNGEANLVGIQGSTRDITERKQAEKDRIARQGAEEASRQKSLFVSNMSHEIRTPHERHPGVCPDPGAGPVPHVPTGGPGPGYQPRGKAPPSSHQRHFGHRPNRGRKDRSQTDRLQPSGPPGRPGDDVSVPGADAEGLELIVERDEALPPHIHGDEGKLRQVLVNLMGNAVKFTEIGGVAVRVRSEPAEAGPEGDGTSMRLICDVEDSGPGIPEEDLAHIFDAFSQAEAGSRAGGTGLGLAISRRFVEMMGGRLTVESTVGKGSCFRFEVLVARAEGIPAPEEAKPRQVTGLEPGEGLFRMLVVDDVKDNRELLYALLEPVGFQVREAENGEEALAVFEDWSPHAVLMDMRMPVMDGYEATCRIKATEAGRNTPVIAVTASAFKDSEEEVLATGVSAYLRKPFRPEDLYEALGECLDLRYVYAEEPARDSRRPERPVLTPESLSALPKDRVKAMGRAVEQGDMGRLRELINGMETLDAAAAAGLRTLAEAYDYETLGRLFGMMNDEREDGK